jgi:hypothetical protein
MMRKVFVLTAFAMLISAAAAMACGDDKEKTGTGTSAMIKSETPQQVTLKGQLVCATCSLKAQGGHSDCKEFGCTQALKTSDGRMVTLMPNQYSKPLMAGKEMSNKPVEITGTLFANANMLDVQSYAVDGGKTMSWCDHCKGMDACKSKTLGSH